MAEFVEFRAEEWVSELKHMERIRLFESKEIKSIATKRRELEYKIERKTKQKEDYLKYIQFEIDLLRLVKARRNKAKIHAKKSEIEHRQTQRISRLFKQAIFRFQDDIKLWMSFFKFCKDVQFQTIVSQMLVRMLQIHSDKPNLWVFAAKWEAEECNSIENARQFLTRGLRHHPSSDILYSELFKLELEHIKIKRREKEKKVKANELIPDEVADSIIEGKVVLIIYESAIKNVEGIDFKLDLLNISKNFDETLNIQNKILQDMVKLHPTEEITWDTLAKREFEGISFDLNQLNEESMEIDSDNATEKKTLKERIQRSINVYEEAVKKLNTVKMWSFYLDHVIEISNSNNSLPLFKYKLLSQAFEDASSLGKLDEKYYLNWIQLLQKSGKKNKKLSEVLKNGTEKHPKSVTLWHARLRFHLLQDQENIGMEVFNDGIDKVPDALPLWKLLIQFLQLKSSSKLEHLFQDGIQWGGDIAQALKPLYIEWLTSTKGIECARKLFLSTNMQHPPCLELYNKMASLESSQPQICLESIRRCYELGCKNFGENNRNIWLEYIKFELEKGDITKVTQIYRRALKNLNSEEADEFVTEYNNLKIGCSK